MILPESLHPALVRRGINGEVKHKLARTSLESFNMSAAGLWLPPSDIAENECKTVNIELPRWAPQIGRIALSDHSCWVAPDSEFSAQEAAKEVATLEVGALPLDDTNGFDSLRLCDESACIYGRHYDLTYACQNQRRTLLEPVPEHYEILAGGEIRTIWGDILPSVNTSAAYLRDLQLQCPPYVPENASPLTAHNIGQITLHALTGCWVVRTFYSRPGYDYDGYGRLCRRAHMAPKGARVRSMQMLAHRVVWQATGRKLQKGRQLNHLCGHRPCANPLHIEQVTKSQNGFHQARMKRAKELLGA